MHILTDKILPILISAGIAVLLLTPLAYGTVETWSVSFFEIVSFLTFGVWCIREILTGMIKVSYSPIYIPFGLFFILIILQLLPLPAHILSFISPHTEALRQQSAQGLNYIFGDNLINTYTISLNPYATKETMILYFSYAAFFIVSANYIVSRRQIKRYFWIIFSIALIESFIGISQYISGGMQLAASGTYINPNHFGGLLTLIIPISLGYVLYAQLRRSGGTDFWQNIIKNKSSNQILVFFATCLIGTALIMSQSRGAILSALASIALFYVLYSWKKKTGSALWFIVIFLAIIAIYSIWIGLDPVIEKFSESKEQLPLRTHLWKDTITLIKDFPIAGTGLGTYSLAFTIYKNEAYWPVVFQHAHNDYLELIAVTGLIGFLLIMWGIVGFYRRTIFQVINLPVQKDPFRYFLLLGCVCGIFGMMVHALTDFNLQIPANTYYFTFLLALSTSLSNQLYKKNKT